MALADRAMRRCVQRFSILMLSLLVSTSFAEPLADSIVTEHVTAQLIAEHDVLAPGEASSIALKLSHQPQWHSYWRTPGDSGMPTQIEWELPAGVEMGAIQWPACRCLCRSPSLMAVRSNISDIALAMGQCQSRVAGVRQRKQVKHGMPRRPTF